MQISLRPEGKRLTNRVHGGDGGGSNSPSRRVTVGIYYRLSWPVYSPPRSWSARNPRWPSRLVFSPTHRRRRDCTSICVAHSPPSRLGAGERSRFVKRLGLAVACQLIVCHLFTRCGGASACNPAGTPPVETTRPHISIVSFISRNSFW